MATQGVFNGTDVFIRVNDGVDWVTLGGQLSHTEVLTNSLLEITNKFSGKVRELLPDEGTQQIDYTVEMIFVSQVGFDFVRALAGNKGQALFQTFRGDGVPTGTTMTEVTLQVQNFVDTSNDGEVLKATVSLMSSDEFEFDLNATYAAFLTNSSEIFRTASGEQFFVRI